MPTLHTSQNGLQQHDVTKLSWNAIPSNEGTRDILAPMGESHYATKHNDAHYNVAPSHDATEFGQSNVQTMRKSIAGPLIKLTNSNRAQIAKLPVAFGFSIPTIEACYEENNVHTSKESALGATKDWIDRGKFATLEMETRDCGIDEWIVQGNNVAKTINASHGISEKLTLIARSRVRRSDNNYAAGNKVNNSSACDSKELAKEKNASAKENYTRDTPPPTESIEDSTIPATAATKTQSRAASGTTVGQQSSQQKKCKITMTGPLFELSQSNRDQIAQLPVAFGFCLRSDENNDCYTSKQLALAATKEWYYKGKIAVMEAEARDLGLDEECFLPVQYIDAAEIHRSDTSKKQTQQAATSILCRPNNCATGAKVQNKSHLLPTTVDATDGNSNIASKGLVLQNEPAASKVINHSILRFQGTAILALHEGVEAYLRRLFNFKNYKLASRRAQGSGNPKKRKELPGKENGSNKNKSASPSNRLSKASSSSSSTSRPVAMLVETSDCPPGLPNGWTSETYRRASGKTAGGTDTYWYTPQLKLKFRSKSNIARFLEILNMPGIDGDESTAWNMFKKRHSA